MGKQAGAAHNEGSSHPFAMSTPAHRSLQALHFPVQYVEVTESLLRARGGDVGSVRRLCGLPPAGDAGAAQPDPSTATTCRR